MEFLLAAGIAGIAGYAYGKRRERREMANGYVTFGSGQDAPGYANLHYGKTGGYHQSSNHHHHQPSQQQYTTAYYPTSR